ncbi:ATP synthase subunit gamma, mitochondrial-like [Saccostrea echinata]|uniref:ATP synthase subunit gamma, mitochondrial-like n=1 Tax=Saccostrea echinata TaxID=191078 RepID=UPI002A815112|nr:ATP synthase subunit gamma, mitochondrial-like [Saccostrea echinata]
MFCRTAQTFIPQCTQVRGMATLKEIRVRLKSVTNIQKITKSMKMVSAAKYAKAERELKPAKPYGEQATALQQNMNMKEDEETEMILALTSDRGLCGSVHSSVVKAIKARLAEKDDCKLLLVGDKAKAMLQKVHGKKVLGHFNDIGKVVPVFQDASKIAMSAITFGLQDFTKVTMYFNSFKSVVAFRTLNIALPTKNNLAGSENYNLYDSIDDEVLQAYNEFTLATMIYYGLKEAQCSEQSSRMTAMDSASKNAGEMIDKLTLTFNRTRQAVITRELIEIISGAAAL